MIPLTYYTWCRLHFSIGIEWDNIKYLCDISCLIYILIPILIITASAIVYLINKHTYPLSYLKNICDRI